MIEDLIKQSNSEFIENELRPFLQIPSNTLNREGIDKAKNFIITYTSKFCEEVREYKGDKNPLILAKVKGNIDKFLLIYMMYDTQPISDDKNWLSSPFGAEIRILPEPLDVLGECIIARGAYNSKTPLICFLNIVKLLKEKNQLPFSLLLLFDGEEEIGSPSLLKFLKNNKGIFEACTDAYYPAIKQDINKRFVLKLGYKGIISLTFNVNTKNKETHSAFSSMIPNPASDLISLLNSIYTNNQFLINSLKEPYDLTMEENSIIKDLIEVLDIEKIKKKAGIVQILETDTKKAFVDYLFKPTFNISTLKSGYLEEGTKNMVANQAICNVDIRFAHNVTVDEIFKEINAKVNEFSKKSNCKIELIKNIGYEGSRVDKNSILVKSLIESNKILGVTTEIWPFSAAAAPLSKIKNEFEWMNFIVGCLGIGGYAHAPNEFVQVDSIGRTRLSIFHFLNIYSKLYSKIS